jgi:hypothetical protein
MSFSICFINNDEEFFNGAQNDTIADVPMGKHDQDESIVIVHNPAAQVYTQLVKI